MEQRSIFCACLCFVALGPSRTGLHYTFQWLENQPVGVIPQTGLALMGFSRYCPSSLDLTNFLVRSCRRAVAEPCAGWKSGNPEIQEAGNLGIQEPAGNLGIQESGNLGIWDPKNQEKKIYQNQNPCRPKCWQGLD